MALESAFYPDQYVGISDDGELQSPEETSAVDRASLFIPFLHSFVTAVSVIKIRLIMTEKRVLKMIKGQSVDMLCQMAFIFYNQEPH